MIIVKNKIIPFAGYKAMAIWPFVFTRVPISNVTLRHETIHGRQQMEMHIVSLVLAIFCAAVGLFSWWWALVSPLMYFAFYGIEYVIKLPCYNFNTRKAYRNISFEREAYLMQGDADYIKNRKPFAWVKYLL